MSTLTSIKANYFSIKMNTETLNNTVLHKEKKVHMILNVPSAHS